MHVFEWQLNARCLFLCRFVVCDFRAAVRVVWEMCRRPDGSCKQLMSSIINTYLGSVITLCYAWLNLNNCTMVAVDGGFFFGILATQWIGMQWSFIKCVKLRFSSSSDRLSHVQTAFKDCFAVYSCMQQQRIRRYRMLIGLFLRTTSLCMQRLSGRPRLNGGLHNGTPHPNQLSCFVSSSATATVVEILIF